MATESELIDEVQRRTGLPRNIVAYIINTEHDVLMECLKRGEEVKTPSVLLHSSSRNTEVGVDGERVRSKHVMIYVRPRSRFKQFLKDKEDDMSMEKYGVETDDTNTKTAGGRTSCPSCGSTNLIRGTVTRCPNCGTAPFESRGGNNNNPRRY